MHILCKSNQNEYSMSFKFNENYRIKNQRFYRKKNQMKIFKKNRRSFELMKGFASHLIEDNEFS